MQQENQNQLQQLPNPKVLQFPSLVSPKVIYRGRQIMKQKAQGKPAKVETP